MSAAPTRRGFVATSAGAGAFVRVPLAAPSYAQTVPAADAAVPIHRLLEKQSFGPDEIRVLVIAFEGALRALRLVDRPDPATEIVAKKIIELAQQGERDPDRLRERAVQSLSG
jgi:hypothetical protein